MVKLLRIDERLIHGQVVTGWSRRLGINAIVVGNDRAAGNSVVSMTLKMAVPQGMKAAVKTVDGAIALLTDRRSEDLVILLVVDNPEDAYAIAAAVPGIEGINVGNYGREHKEENHRATLSKGFFANETEILQFQRLLTLEIPCTIQMTAYEEKEDLEKVLKLRQGRGD